MDLTVTLTDDQLEATAHRVAALPSDPPASERMAESMSVSRATELAGVSATTVRNGLSAGLLTRQGVPLRPMVLRTELLAILTRDKSGLGAPRKAATRSRRRHGGGHVVGLARDRGLR